MAASSTQEFRVTLRDFLIVQAGIILLVETRVHYHDWFSLHENVQIFPMITITQDTGRSFQGLSSVHDIFISGHSNKTFFEAHEVLQAVTDVLDPTTEWLGDSFCIRGLANPTEIYDSRSRVYTARKKFRVNLVGA